MARRTVRPSRPATVTKDDGNNPRVAIQHTTEQWIGPLPHPSALEAFERASPGTAATIVQEFTTEAAHRRAMETRQAFLVVAETLIGQISAIVFALAALGVAAFAAAHNAQWIGSIVGGGVIVSGIIALRQSARNKKP